MMWLGPAEVEDGGEIGGEIDDFRRGRRAPKIETENADEQKDKESAGARPKESVVKAERGADEDAEPLRLFRRVFRLMNDAEVLDEEDIDSDQDQQDEDDRAKGSGVEKRDNPRTKEGKNEGGARGRQDRGPIEGDVPGGTVDAMVVPAQEANLFVPRIVAMGRCGKRINIAGN